MKDFLIPIQNVTQTPDFLLIYLNISVSGTAELQDKIHFFLMSLGFQLHYVVEIGAD